MDYKTKKIIELKEIAKELGLEHGQLAKKKELVNLLEKHQKAEMLKKQKEEKEKIEIYNEEHREEIDNELMESLVRRAPSDKFDAKETKIVEKIALSMVEIGRKNRNLIDDITLDVNLLSELGSNYNKKYFAKVEKILNQKNIDIDYSSDLLRDEIAIIRDTNYEIEEDEINYSIDSLLKGISKPQDSDEVKNFLSSINDYPLLGKEKEMELGKIIAEAHEKKKQGEELTFFENEKYEDARELLSLSNKRLVVSVAKKYINRGMDLIDLVMEGMLGLEKAIIKYDYETGFKFSTYATWWVRQGITRAIADKSKVIRIPVHMVETINKVTKVQRELTQKLGQEPTFKEIGEQFDPVMSIEEIEHIFNIAKDPIPLEMPIGEDNSSLESFIEDDKHMSQSQESEKNELRFNLLEIIEEIPEREGEVLLYRYGLYDLDTTPLIEKIKLLQEVKELLSTSVINCKEAETIIKNTNYIPLHQRTKYAKRIIQNNEKFLKRLEDLERYNNKIDKKSIEKAEKAQKSLEVIKDNNIHFLEKLIELTQDQIKILGKIDELTEGVVKALTLEEVGKLFEVTRERIRQIETKGKRKLKAFADKEQLGLYIHE
ncbi:MAG: sigma-70 family RNA polymerase sigma factor [Mycoplasmatales bacterium]